MDGWMGAGWVIWCAARAGAGHLGAWAAGPASTAPAPRPATPPQRTARLAPVGSSGPMSADTASCPAAVILSRTKKHAAPSCSSCTAEMTDPPARPSTCGRPRAAGRSAAGHLDASCGCCGRSTPNGACVASGAACATHEERRADGVGADGVVDAGGAQLDPPVQHLQQRRLRGRAAVCSHHRLAAAAVPHHLRASGAVAVAVQQGGWGETGAKSRAQAE